MPLMTGLPATFYPLIVGEQPEAYAVSNKLRPRTPVVWS